MVLHPMAEAYDAAARKSNDMSCVLKVSGPYGSALLTSDIEAISERALLNRHAGELKSDVLVVPHHGSRTSSTPAFIDAVDAAIVIFPVGYSNRFHHPNAEVLARYRAGGAKLYRTDLDGALTVHLGQGAAAIVSERVARRRYWHGR